MTQQPTQFCTECGAPGPLDQRFCSNCGSAMKASPNDPTIAASGQFSTMGATLQNTNRPVAQANTSADPYMTRNQDNTPPPPPPTSGAYNPYTPNAPGGPQAYAQNISTPVNTNPPTPGMYNPVPSYAQAKKSHGCLITSIVLLLILAAGIGGFVFLKMPFTHSQANGNTPNTNGTSTSGGSTGGTTGTAGTTNGAHTEQLNLKLTFASIQTTIISVQSASSFADDPAGSNQPEIVRLNLHEVNSTANNSNYLESDVLRLILPDGTSTQSANQQQNISPNAGVSRDNWIDFPLTHAVRLDQLTLRIGTPAQHQMDVPLKATANLSKYQDKTSNPNTQFQYNGLDWTFKNATLSYSYNNRQASTGNLYVIITLSVSNQTASDAAIFPNDFMRMQAGSSTQAPDSYNFQYNTPAHGTNGGVVGFLVPQNATSFTLIMLGNASVNPPVAQVTQTFQIS